MCTAIVANGAHLTLSRETSAATTIQRVWRTSRATIELLRSYEIMKSLNHRGFQRLCSLLKKTKRKTWPQTLTATIQIVHDIREKLSDRRVIPLFISVGQIGEEVRLPTYVLIDQRSLQYFYPYEDLCFTSDSLRAYQEMDIRQIASREEANKLVQELYKTDMIPWDFVKDGCGTRARVAISLLRITGIAEDSIFNCQIFDSDLRFKTANGKQVSWTYHIAPLVKCRDGSKVILDPAIDKLKALTIEEWVDSMDRSSRRLTFVDTTADEQKDYEPEEDTSFVFITERTKFVYLYQEKYGLFPITSISGDESQLAQMRASMEQEWCSSIFE